MAEEAVRGVLEQLLVALGTPKNGEPRRGALLVALTAKGDTGGTPCTLIVAASRPLSRDLNPKVLELEPAPPDVTFGVRWDPPEGDRDPQTPHDGDPKTLLVFLFLRHRDPFGGYDAGMRRLLLPQLDPVLRLGRPALARGLRTLLQPLLGGLHRQHQAQQVVARAQALAVAAVTAVVAASSSARFRSACLGALQGPPKSSAGGGGRNSSRRRRRRRKKGSETTRARDHPSVIKRRFTSVLVVSGLSPALVWLWKELTGVKADTPLPALLGLRLEGLVPATLLPLLLTMILFLGPLIQLSMDCPWRWLDGIRVALDPRVWALCLGDVRWLRNQVVAPLTEELVFRACMLPMLVPCTGPGPAVLACPLFFGVAHFHHVIEQLRFRHGSVGSIFMAAAFQFSYTAVFGAYTAFLFLRTGHLAGPVLCHSFCNSMGFPALGAALGHPRRRALLPAYLLGVLGFLLLLHPLTEPAFFGARPPCRDPPACS
ncbi:hypothetical protein HGM15179_016793 [Zosterops borbonicus]|uniref:CAAX prenyl protease 2 n=1 Tax=Zosterops borbonicus TaxID=364589 RepID=A0A8K1G2E5_9PASS|nr:hypothetical protein HGM15179_016793 [Zosterops borbonicus]